MMTENIQALVAYRLEQADESIEAASTLLDKKLIRPCVNRAYYAMFYAVLARFLPRGKKKPRSIAVQFHYLTRTLSSRAYLKRIIPDGCTMPSICVNAPIMRQNIKFLKKKLEKR